MLDLGGGRLLAAADAKIMQSLDYGATWSQLYDTGYGYVFSLISPAKGIILSAGDGGVIYRSADAGATWAQVADFGEDTACCLTNCGNGVILAGWNTAGPAAPQILRSVDYGLTWQSVRTLTGETGLDALIYCGDDGICLAGTNPNGKIYISSDYGATWAYLSRPGAETAINSLLCINSGNYFCGCSGGKIYHSTDYGETWSLVKSTGKAEVRTLATLGSGLILAGTNTSGVYRSIDGGDTWSLIATPPADEIRSFITLGNGSVLAGTGSSGEIYISKNCAADLDITHNLGFMPSTAVEPSEYFQLAPPKFDPLQVHLKYQSADFIRVNLPGGGTYDLTCAEVTEILDLKKPSMPWRHVITSTAWLTNTAGGAMPSTIERVAAYTPLVTTNFNNNLDASINNLQAFADRVDDLDMGGGGCGNSFPVGSVFLSVVSTNPATLLGYGTWSAIGAGRVLVGYDGSDTDFNAAEKTGGAKTVASNVSVNAHNTSSFTRTDPPSATFLTGPASHTVTNNATSVVQPYLVVYMWKRTA